jgi:hypothetical protein
MRAAGAWRCATAMIAVSFLGACAAFPNPDGAAPTAHHSAPAYPPPATAARPAPRQPGSQPARPGPGPEARLAAALARVLSHQAASFAVGIVNQATGATATYHASRTFDTASIVKADILAVLLLQHQQIGAPLSGQEQALAARMIEDSDNAAASALWNAVEGAPGMEAGNAALGLRATVPGSDGYWGLTTTTVADQLRLLSDLTSSRSPLHAPARRYELGLMHAVEHSQAWGITAAADPGTRPAVKNGWLPAGPEQTWTVNSIGVVSCARQQLTIAVLSAGQPSASAGIRLVQAAARAAASAITDSADPRTRRPG